MEIVESCPEPNTAEVPQFIPGEILKILNSCHRVMKTGFSTKIYLIIQHEATAICTCDKPSRSSRLGTGFNTKNIEKEVRS